MGDSGIGEFECSLGAGDSDGVVSASSSASTCLGWSISFVSFVGLASSFVAVSSSHSFFFGDGGGDDSCCAISGSSKGIFGLKSASGSDWMVTGDSDSGSSSA